MELRKGDRFSIKGYMMEIIEVGEPAHFKVLASEDQRLWRLGEIASISRDYTWDGWDYLGNFSKSKNFDNLYDKLNEGG